MRDKWCSMWGMSQTSGDAYRKDDFARANGIASEHVLVYGYNAPGVFSWIGAGLIIGMPAATAGMYGLDYHGRFPDVDLTRPIVIFVGALLVLAIFVLRGLRTQEAILTAKEVIYRIGSTPRRIPVADIQDLILHRPHRRDSRKSLSIVGSRQQIKMVFDIWTLEAFHQQLVRQVSIETLERIEVRRNRERIYMVVAYCLVIAFCFLFEIWRMKR